MLARSHHPRRALRTLALRASRLIPRRLTDFEREVIFRRAALEAAEQGTPAPFRLRAGLIVETALVLRRAATTRSHRRGVRSVAHGQPRAERRHRSRRRTAPAADALSLRGLHDLRAANRGDRIGSMNIGCAALLSARSRETPGLSPRDRHGAGSGGGSSRVLAGRLRPARAAAASRAARHRCDRERAGGRLPPAHPRCATRDRGGAIRNSRRASGARRARAWQSRRRGSHAGSSAAIEKRNWPMSRGRSSGDGCCPLNRTAVVFQRPLPYLYLARQVFPDAEIPYQAFDALPLAAEPFAAALDLVFVVRHVGRHAGLDRGTPRLSPLVVRNRWQSHRPRRRGCRRRPAQGSEVRRWMGAAGLAGRGGVNGRGD